MKIAAQLYTLREEYKSKEEFIQILHKVKDIGFDGVEFSGYAGLKASELKDVLKETGLKALSAHYTVEDFTHNADEILIYLNEIGCPNLVMAYSETDTMEKISHTLELLRKMQEKANKYSIKVSYHNHSHEFNPLPTKEVPIDLIKAESMLELDTYWTLHGKSNPVSYIEDNWKNIQLYHIKDGDNTGHPVALGEGINDIKGIVKAIQKIGAEWVIIENDFPTPDGINDLTRSMKYLNSLI